ncbi:hypothetical protein [Pseudonocardia spinosispora]|uniref:hypothetical protein n=1 Tax=Pseudonocardia spinosispora TaxID=103441 RepID=UPI00040A3C48|nr:hypothetical protein [Pseudonocardia spinosispora]
MKTSLVRLLDSACTEILDGYRDGRARPWQLHVSPAAFEAISRIKQSEVSRGNPLMLLDLGVVADRSLDGDATVVTWHPNPPPEETPC